MPSKNPPPASRSLSPEEESLWIKVTETIVPLSKRSNRITGATDPTNTNQNKELFRAIIKKRSDLTPELALVAKTPPENPIDRKTRLSLNRGRITIEGRIDLHGMTQRKAHEALLRFLENAYHADKRHLLVITGKGRQSDGGVGVLRGVVPHWLTTPPMRNWVRAHGPAGPRDGGDGALYVSMKRFR